MKAETVLTCVAGSNADLFPYVLSLYVSPGASVIDVTYGKGVFWKRVPDQKYNLTAADIQRGIDFTALPYADEEFDAVVFDPPYMNGGSGVKESLNDCYKNSGVGSYEAVYRLYIKGILEAHRVLKKKGVLIIKCQACVADHVQKPIHVHLISGLPPFGFRFEDEFILHASAKPIMRHTTQKHARKNHSYFLVFTKTR